MIVTPTRQRFPVPEDVDFEQRYDELITNDPRLALTIADVFSFSDCALGIYLYPKLVHCRPPIGNVALKSLGLSYAKASQRSPLHFDEGNNRKAIECFSMLEARSPAALVPLELCLELLLDRLLMTSVGVDLETWMARDRPLPNDDAIDHAVLNGILQHYARDLDMTNDPSAPLCLLRLLEIAPDTAGQKIVEQQLTPALRNFISKHGGGSASVDVLRECLSLAQRIEGTNTTSLKLPSKTDTNQPLLPQCSELNK